MRSPAVSPALCASLAERLRQCRSSTLELVSDLSDEDCTPQSMADASPAKWHLAHTTWFFETFVLARILPKYQPFCRDYAYLFNSYYEAVGPRHCRSKRGLLTRPPLAEVKEYRHRIDEALAAWLAAGDAPLHLLSVIELGLHHEQQHQELLLTDIKHLFAQNPMFPSYARVADAARAGSVERIPARSSVSTQTQVRTPESHAIWLRGPHGVEPLGTSEPTFAFDNERPQHRVFLEKYDFASELVTCAEYRAFIEGGGYEQPRWWLSDGWAASQRNGWRAPLYWEREGDTWVHYTLRGRRPVAGDEPVTHVSYYEADAFARWAGARLPTESEWEAMARAVPVRGGFLESRRFHPEAAPRNADGASNSAAVRPAQMFGEVWQWTSSAYGPYPGFRPIEGDLGEYNGKFMCNQFVLRGGSCVSPSTHLRATYRNFFGPEARWQFSGIRLAKSAP